MSQSSRGIPIISQMTAVGSRPATSTEKSHSPRGATVSIIELTIWRMCGSRAATSGWPKCRLTSARIFSWRGGSVQLSISPMPVSPPARSRLSTKLSTLPLSSELNRCAIGEDREAVAHLGQRPETFAGLAFMPIDRRLRAHDAPGLEAVAIAKKIEIGEVYLLEPHLRSPREITSRDLLLLPENQMARRLPYP